MKITTLFVLFLSLALALQARPTTKFTTHTVAKGETLYSISRQYGVKPAELASYNDAIGSDFAIRIGQKLKVPAELSATSDKETETPQAVKAKPVAAPAPAATAPDVASAESGDYHIVKKGETFYSIARTYNLSRPNLQAWNNLDDLNLKVGQRIIVKQNGSTATQSGSATASTSKDDVRKAMAKGGYTWTLPKVQESNVSTATGDATASSSNVGLASTRTIKSWKTESATERMENYKPKASFDPSSEYESLYYQNVYSGLNKKTETGVVKLMTDNNTAHIAYYNNASVGTILKLTNTDNGKTSYAIVVGKVPPAENNTYLVKLSEKVARNLSIKDYTSIEVVCYTGN